MDLVVYDMMRYNLLLAIKMMIIILFMMLVIEVKVLHLMMHFSISFLISTFYQVTLKLLILKTLYY